MRAAAWLRGVVLVAATVASAGESVATPSSGRLLATSGVSAIEGGAGGGIVPWAIIAGYGSENEWGGSAFATRLETDDYALGVRGAALGYRNRLELSLARQALQLPALAPALDLPPQRLRQDVLGAKLRLAGDLVYTPWPQLAAGAQYKRLRDFAIPSAVGASDDDDVDYYLSASKLWLAGFGGRNLLANATLRSTRANQTGLLGFGGDRRGGRSLVGELSVALLLDRRWALGAEFRQKPDNLGFAREDDWRDVFVAWFPNKTLAVTVAWADLGSIATVDDQRGWYLSVQLTR